MSIDDYREEFYYTLLELTAKAYKSSSYIKEKAVGKLGVENLYNNNTKTIKTGGQFNGNQIDFSNIKNDYWDITGFGLFSMLSREDETLFSASPLDIIVTELHTSRPGSALYGNGVDKTFVRQPAICVKYLLDEQDKQFNWERLAQLGQNTAYATLFYVGVEYALPYMAEKAIFQGLFKDALAQVFAKTVSNGGDLIGAIDDIDYFNAGVKGLMGSKYKVFQEILKTYGTLNINVDGVKFNIEDFNEATTIELFHRLIFAHIPDNLKGGDKFSWDVLKNYTRGQMQDASEMMLEDLNRFLEADPTINIKSKE